MASRGWQTTALATAAVALATAPLIYFQWQRSIQRAERQQALRLLHKVELIVSEVTVRLMHLENQVDDFVAYQLRGDNADDVEAAASSLNSYYHFDSQGNKLKTKWDSYDVDEELKKLDNEDASGMNEKKEAAPANRRPAEPAMSKMKLLAAAGGIEHEFEAVLEFLDDVRGDEQVKQQRKAIANKITSEQFARIDSIRAALGVHQ